MDYEKLIIESYGNWDLKLHHDQGILGRHLLWYTGEGEFSDILELFGGRKETREELEMICNIGKNAVNKIFPADKWNYVSAGNRTDHLHWHNIPRRDKPIQFAGYVFSDSKPHTLSLPTARLNENIIFAIRDAIRDAL